MDVRHCKTCNARIIWAWTVNGRRTPIDAEPVEGSPKAGHYVLVKRLPDPYSDAPLAVPATQALTDAGAAVYLTHWSTCPTSGQHRRPPATQDGLARTAMPEGSARQAAQGGGDDSGDVPAARTTWRVANTSSLDALKVVAGAGATVSNEQMRLTVYVSSADPAIVDRIERVASRNGVHLVRLAS